MNPKLFIFLFLLCFSNQPFSVSALRFGGLGKALKNLGDTLSGIAAFCDVIKDFSPSYNCGSVSNAVYQPYDTNEDSMPDVSLTNIIVNFSVGGGNSPQNISLILDTTLDYTFMLCTPCSDSCSTYLPVYNPSLSSTYSNYTCDSSECPSLKDYVSCSSGSCMYNYTDSTYVSSVGSLVTDTIDVSSDPFIFGCGEMNKGNYGNSVGFFGLGNYGLSLLNQTNDGKFSYCIGSSGDGVFLLGSNAQLKNPSSAYSTYFLTNTLVPQFYYVNFTGVKIGGQYVDIPSNAYLPQPDGTGGMILATTSYFTYLEESAYNATRDEFLNQMGSFTQVDESQYGLDLCFAIPPGEQPTIPQLTLLFDGVEFSPQSDLYFQTVDSNGTVGCLIVFSSLGVSVLGSLMQLDTHMVYDVSNGMLQFESIDCSTLG